MVWPIESESLLFCLNRLLPSSQTPHPTVKPKKYTPQPPGLMVCISSIIYSTYPDCIHCIPDIFVRGQRETDSQGYPVVLCSDVR